MKIVVYINGEEIYTIHNATIEKYDELCKSLERKAKTDISSQVITEFSSFLNGNKICYISAEHTMIDWCQSIEFIKD